MKRFKIYLAERVLPVYVRESLIRENEALREKLARLESFVEGLQWAVKHQRRIQIRGKEEGNGL